MPEVKAYYADRSIEAEGELTSSDIISQFLRSILRYARDRDAHRLSF